ncbi:MAG: glycosyltransferase family 39 protein [Gemmataceae bacterium]
MGSPLSWRMAAAVLIFVVSAFRIAFVGWWSPLDLSTDEAHYWDWSRNLDWSYYSKGPLVAWLIRLSLELCGSLSQTLTGSTVLAIRFPAIVCGAALLVAMYVLTVQVFKRDSLAFAVTALMSVLPATTVGGVLITIDAPFVALWSWALVIGHCAVFGGKKWAWPLLGLVLGLGTLAKYTMLLWPASAILFCLFTPDYRPLLRRPGVWIAAVVLAVCCLPILIWNIQHDWISLKHVAGQAGVSQVDEKSSFRWVGPFEYIGGQFAVGMGVFFLIWLYSLVASRPGREQNPQKLFLWWMSVTTFLFFMTFSFRVSIQVNWPIAGFISGIVLASDWLVQRWNHVIPHERRNWRFVTVLGCGLAVAVSLLALESQIARPLINPIVKNITARFVDPSSERAKAPLRIWDVSCRLRGWKDLARQIDQIRAEIAEKEGREPLLATDRWNKAGEFGFYCQGNPRVSCFGRAVGDRYSQYDLWRPNPIDDAQEYRGRTFVIIGEPKAEYRDAFDRYVETEMKTLEYREDGELVTWMYVTIGQGFKGFKTIRPAGN